MHRISSSDNTSVAIAMDLDGDGDLDLFVGSRNVPMQYGLNPANHVYLNDGHGHFTELSNAGMGALGRAGMITGAIWADILGSGKNQLVLVGDWMHPMVFSFNKNQFVEINTNLDHLNGWWRSIAARDLNGDGKPDLVLGNIGENFCIQNHL
jgi:hypothetical protein